LYLTPLPDKGKIYGKVSNIFTGAGIGKATVTTNPPTSEVKTEEDGLYVIDGVAPDSYKVIVAAPGYSASSKLVTVEEGKTVEVNIQITPLASTGSIAGIVKDVNDGSGIADATVTTDPQTTTAITEPDGSYRIVDVLPGVYKVVVTASGYNPNSVEVNIYAGVKTVKDIVLQPPVSTVDSEGDAGTYFKTDIALDSNGFPHIIYGKYARWTGDGWAIDNSCGGESIAVDNNGYPHISSGATYKRRGPNGWIKDSVPYIAGGVVDYSSIALDSNGYPHISIIDTSDWILSYSKWTGSDWSAEMVDSGFYRTSIVLDSNNSTHISYWNSGVKYAKLSGSSWLIQVIDGAGNNPSLSLDSLDNPHISYYDETNGDLKYAYNDGSGWSIKIVDSNGNVGEYNSIALDGNDNPHISYYDTTNGDLKYAGWTGTSWVISTIDSVKVC